MAYYLTTALGREVPLDDWQSLHRDTILKLLYGYATSGFNRTNEALDVASLSNATGLRPQDTLMLCHQLRDAGRANDFGLRFSITQKGIELVRSVLSRIDG